MFKLSKSIPLILLSFLTCFSESQAQIAFEHLTAQEGLSSHTVYSCVQDDLGFMWFGTRDGLNKYDGTDVTIYTYDPENPLSLSDNNFLKFSRFRLFLRLFANS